MSMSSDKGYLIPVSSITLHVNISPCSDKTWRACVLWSHTIMCPAVVVTTSKGRNCLVTLILECRGQLWVGCHSGEQSRATIHKVKLL
jgi:hypothetical protein